MHKDQSKLNEKCSIARNSGNTLLIALLYKFEFLDMDTGW